MKLLRYANGTVKLFNNRINPECFGKECDQVALSQWPDKFIKQDKKDDRAPLIEAWVQGKVIKVTTDAVLLQTGDVKTWVPKSQCPIIENAKLGDYFEHIEVPEWFAKEKQLLP